MKKLLILGLGQLGTSCQTVFMNNGWDVAAYTKFGCDVTDSEAVYKVISQEKPRLVLNCAAFHNVQQCEQYPDMAYSVNAEGAKVVAGTAKIFDIPVIYISTDQVFNGLRDSPYFEHDQVSPLNEYGHSKVRGEDQTRFYCPEHYIIRAGCLYGENGSRQKDGNFITKLFSGNGKTIRMTVAGTICPTYTMDLAQGIFDLCARYKPFGTYHLVSKGHTSWYGLAMRAFSFWEGPYVPLIPIKEDPSGISRPAYSVLDTSKAEAQGVVLPHWSDGLKRYVSELHHRHIELLERQAERHPRGHPEDLGSRITGQ